MEELARFGVSISSELLESFDELIASKGYKNRSEAIRDLIRNYLVEYEREEDVETMGAVTMVYDHTYPYRRVQLSGRALHSV